MTVEIVACTQPEVEGVDAQDFTAYVARIGKVKDNPEKLLMYLMQHKHWSPYEHCYATFKIRTSRAIGRELLRHRSFTFQELSQRYEKVLEFEPIELRKQSEKNRQSSTEAFDPVFGYIRHEGEEDKAYTASRSIEYLLKTIKAAYEQLLEHGIARECARMILPECTSTTLLMTGNLRSWIHFLAVRNHPDAQKEAQEIAKEIATILTERFPIIMNAINE